MKEEWHFAKIRPEQGYQNDRKYHSLPWGKKVNKGIPSNPVGIFFSIYQFFIKQNSIYLFCLGIYKV